MQWQGLPFSTLLPIGLAASLAIVALYFLRLRRRVVAVPFVKLWERVLRDEDSSRLFSRIKQLLSLLLQLAILALLLLALADPRKEASHAEGRHFVVLVDASASMQATDVSEEGAERTRLDDAKEEVRRMAKDLGGSDRMLIAQVDAHVTPLSSFTSDVTELEGALDRLRATDTRADFHGALRFATDVLQALPSPQIVIVSDGAVSLPSEAEVSLGDVNVSYVPIGRRGRNVAIVELTARRYPLDRDRYEVMLELYNAGSEAEDVELRLYGDGNVIDVTRLRLGPRERLPRFYPNLSGAREELEAVVKLTDGTSDDLPADNRAHALLPDVKRARVLCVTEGNTYLEAALLLASYLDVTHVTPEEYAAVEGRFDVTIFDGVTPEVKDGSGNLLYLDPQGPHAPLGVAEKALTNVGFDRIDKKSPLLRWTSIEDAFIAKARRLSPRPGDRVVGASELGPLLVSGVRDGKRFVALGFHPKDSDLVLRVAWPVFMLNTLNELASEDADFLSSYRTGEVWHVPVLTDAERVTLVEPSGDTREVPIQDGRAVLFGDRAGFYTLKDESSALRVRFAANLADPEESTIEPASSLTILGKEAQPRPVFEGRARRQPWVWLILAAVLLGSLEWFTFHRRITV